MNRTELVLKLFKPDENGVSRWVDKEECIGEYASLYPTNGNMWYRNSGLRKFIFEKDTSNNSVKWRFNGLKNENTSRNIRLDIWNEIRNQPCVVTGLKLQNGHKIEVDHKDGRYPNSVLDPKTQRFEDFQALLDTLNKVKRTCCLMCVKNGKRFDAKSLGFGVSVTEGTLDYKGTCVGCYWYDIKEFISRLKIVD